MGRPLSYQSQSVNRDIWTVEGQVSAAGVVTGDGFTSSAPSSSAFTLTLQSRPARVLGIFLQCVAGDARITTAYNATTGAVVVTTYDIDDTVAGTRTAADKAFYVRFVCSNSTARP